MNSLSKELERLRKSDSDVATILDVFEEIERVYTDIRKAVEGVAGYTPPDSRKFDESSYLIPAKFIIL